MSKSWKRPDFWTVTKILILLMFLIFLIYPMCTLLIRGFKSPDGGGFTLDNFKTFFSKRYYYSTLFNSFAVTICVTLLTVLIGTPMAYIVNFYKLKGRKFIEVLVIISMMSPAFIGAYSWILLCGRNGVLTNFLMNTFGIEMPPIYGFKGILLVFTLKLYPFIYLYVSGALKKIDVSLIEAGESLGCHGLKRITTIVLPLVAPTLLAAGLMVFMSSLADFGTPMLIGEGFRTLPVLIYQQFINEMGGQANFASAIANIMMVITAVVFLIQRRYLNKKSYVMSALNTIQPKEPKGIKGVLMHIYTYGVALAAIIPLVMVVITSFKNTRLSIFVDGYSLDSYRAVLSEMGSAIVNTYVFGFAALILIICMGMFIAYLTNRRRSFITSVIDITSMLPYIIPGSVLGITMLLSFNKKPVMISGTAFIIILVFVIRRLPHTLRSSTAIMYQISPSVEEASISLGASPVKSFFQITAVMMLPGVCSGALLSWITIINELSASILLYTTKTRTMSIMIYTEVIRGNYGTAAALATILTGTTLISLLVFFKITKGKDITM